MPKSSKQPKQPAPKQPKQSAPALTFAQLLERDTTTSPPSSGKACKEFLDGMKASYEAGKSHSGARLELACAILWAQAHIDDPASAFCVLPDAQRRLLLTGLGLDVGLLAGTSWPVAIARRAAAFMVSGQSPTKKPKAGSRGGRDSGARRQLSKSAHRVGAFPDDGEEDSDDDAEQPHRRPRPAPKARAPKQASKQTSRSTASDSDASADGSGGGDSSSGSDSGSESDSSSSSESSAVSSSSASDSSAGSRRKRSRPTRSKASKKSGRSRSLSGLELDDKRRIKKLCAAKWLRGSDLRDGLPSHWYFMLHSGHSWSSKQQREYERTRRAARKGRSVRREDPSNPAWVHRLSFIYGADNTLDTDAANLARLVRGETRGDFVKNKVTQHRSLESYEEHLKELRERFQRVADALDDGHLPGETEVGDVFHSLLAAYSRRFIAMRRALRSGGDAASEVLANTARQYNEVGTFFKRFRADLGARSRNVKDYHKRFQFIGGRLDALLRPIVQSVLEMEAYEPSKDALSLERRTSRAEKPAAPPSPAPKRARSEAPPPAPAAVLAPPLAGGQLSYQIAPPAYGLPVAAPPQYAQPPSQYAQPPWGHPLLSPSGTALAAQAAPSLPPPPYQASTPGGPALAASRTVAASPVAATPLASTGKRGQGLKVHFDASAGGSSGRTSAGSVGKGASGAAVKEEFSPETGFVGLPAHPWVCGTNGAPPMPDGVQAYHPQCRCSRVLNFPGPHATWDCPLRYFSRRGSCPGFLPSGHRDPSAWNGDEITAETKQLWRRFVSAHDGMPALKVAATALGGPPSFD